MLPEPYSIVGMDETGGFIPLNDGDLIAFHDGEIGRYNERESLYHNLLRAIWIDFDGGYSFRLVEDIDIETTILLM